MISKRELERRIGMLEQEVASQRQVINELAARAGVSVPARPSQFAAPAQVPVQPTAGGSAAGVLPPQARQALAEGKKIEAIKLVREATGLGLKEAKDTVDRAIAGQAAPGSTSAWS